MTLSNRIASVVIGALGSQAIELSSSNFRIVFNVEKTDGKDPNTARIDIYNLSENTRNLIKKLNEFVVLNAGYVYGDGAQLLFSGDISSIIHKKTSPDIVTTISADDGKNSLTKYKISLSHSSGTSATVILNKILNTFPIGNNLEKVLYTNKKYVNGFAFAGLARDALTKVTEFLDLDWTIQNNKIILTLFDSDDLTQSMYLSEETGMINSPERLTSSARKAKKKSNKNKPGWRFTSLLMPQINPKNKIAAESSEIKSNSVFTVSTVSHNGDTHGSEWTTVTEVRE